MTKDQIVTNVDQIDRKLRTIIKIDTNLDKIDDNKFSKLFISSIELNSLI